MFYPLFLILFVAITTCSFASDAMDTTKHSGNPAPVKTDTTTNKYGVLTGTVTDSTGNPLAGATVRVEGTTRGGYTKSDGTFCILKIKPGTYTIRVASLGFRDEAHTLTIIQQDTTVANFTMLEDEHRNTSLDNWSCGPWLADPYKIGTIRTLNNVELNSTPP